VYDNRDDASESGPSPSPPSCILRRQYFLENDPDLQVIVNDFTPEMFSVEVIEVLGTTLGTDVYIRNFVAQNFILLKIAGNVDNFDEGN
jgi:hypothetical protein